MRGEGYGDALCARWSRREDEHGGTMDTVWQKAASSCLALPQSIGGFVLTGITWSQNLMKWNGGGMTSGGGRLKAICIGLQHLLRQDSTRPFHNVQSILLTQ